MAGDDASDGDDEVPPDFIRSTRKDVDPEEFRKRWAGKIRQPGEHAPHPVDSDEDTSPTLSAPPVEMTTTGYITDHFYSIDGTDPLDAGEFTFRSENRLLAETSRGLQVTTGIAGGPIGFRVMSSLYRPRFADESWEWVVEGPVTTKDGIITIRDAGVEVGNLATRGPGLYRVRVAVNGLDASYDDQVDDVVETHSIWVWQDPRAGFQMLASPGQPKVTVSIAYKERPPKRERTHEEEQQALRNYIASEAGGDAFDQPYDRFAAARAASPKYANEPVARTREEGLGLGPDDSIVEPVPGVPFTATEVAYTEFGHFTIDALSHQEIAEPPETWVDRMLALSPTGIFIACGMAMGVANVTVQSSLERPPVADGWEHVVEASVTTSQRGELYLAGFYDVTEITGNLAAAGVGEYRIRVSANGRALDFDDVADEPVEDYLVQVWPEPASAPKVLLSPPGQQLT